LKYAEFNSDYYGLTRSMHKLCVFQGIITFSLSLSKKSAS